MAVVPLCGSGLSLCLWVCLSPQGWMRRSQVASVVGHVGRAGPPMPTPSDGEVGLCSQLPCRALLPLAHVGQGPVPACCPLCVQDGICCLFLLGLVLGLWLPRLPF